MTTMRRLIERWDQVRTGTLIWVNAAIGLFFLLPHALVTVFAAPANGATFHLSIIDAAAIVLLIAAIGRAFGDSAIVTILRIQTGILLPICMWWVYYGLDTLFFSAIPDGNFVWNVAAYTFVVAYPIYLVRRVYLAARIPRNWAMYYAHALAAAFAVTISLGIYWRLYRGAV